MLKILENIPLAPLTTLKIGGAARLFVEAKSEDEVVEAFNIADQNNLEIFIIGGGSNVLIADAGFDGLVIQIGLKGLKTSKISHEKFLVTAQAGEDWDEFVRFCVEQNLAGVECLSGIPGFTGGTPVQNVGAYGQEVSETIKKVRAFDRKSKQILELSNADCKFAYRTSIFNTTDRDRFIVLSVDFELTGNGAPRIVYKDLAEFFSGKTPTLAETRRAVLEIRRAKSMVIDESDINSRSAGSFFKNPIVSRQFYDEVTARFGREIPYFPAGENTVKIPAAWLIEQSGFKKGFIKGSVGLSAKHPLALINRGGGTARDIIELKNEIQKTVEKKFSIEIKPEPVFIGFG